MSESRPGQHARSQPIDDRGTDAARRDEPPLPADGLGAAVPTPRGQQAAAVLLVGVVLAGIVLSAWAWTGRQPPAPPAYTKGWSAFYVWLDGTLRGPFEQRGGGSTEWRKLWGLADQRWTDWLVELPPDSVAAFAEEAQRAYEAVSRRPRPTPIVGRLEPGLARDDGTGAAQTRASPAAPGPAAPGVAAPEDAVCAADLAVLSGQLVGLGRDEWRLAHAWFTRALEHDPAHVQAWLDRGMAAILGGFVEAAREAFDRAIELDPARPDGWYLRSSLHLRERPGQPEAAAAALADLRQAIACEAEHADAWRALAEWHARQAEWQQAHAAINTALAVRPTDPRLLLVRGRILQRLEELGAAAYAEAGMRAGGAQADWDEAYRRTRPTLHGWMLRAAIERERGRTAAAVEAFLQAIEIAPRHVPAHLDVAELLESTGNTVFAARHYMAAIEAEPDGPDAWVAWLGLVRLHEAQGADDQAAIAWDEVQRLAPQAVRDRLRREGAGAE